MRLFLALPLPDSIRTELLHLQQALKTLHEGKTISWTRPENLHLTIKFLGETPDLHLPALRSALDRLPRPIHPFKLRISGIHYLPRRGQIRVIAASLDGDAAPLCEFATQVDQLCHRLGYPLEARPFHPHITLARPKSPLSRSHHPPLDRKPTLEFALSNLELIESTLNPSGPSYTTLAVYPFSCVI